MMISRSLFLEGVLIAAALFAPAAYGSVYPWGFGILCAAVFFLVFVFADRLSGSNLPPVPWLWGLLLAWILIQAIFFSYTPRQSQIEVLKWLAAAGLFMVCQELRRSSMIKIFWVIAAAGVLQGLYGLAQAVSDYTGVLGLQQGIHAGFATGTFLNRNHFAGFIELSMGVQAGLFLRAYHKHRFWQVVALSFMFLISAIALIKSGSRTGAFSFGIAFLILGLLVHRRYTSGSLLIWFFFPAFLVMGVLWGWDILSPRLETVSRTLLTLEGRLDIWRDTLRMTGAVFWQGAGLGAFSQVFSLFQMDAAERIWNHVHNDYLELTAELGVPAMILFAVAWMLSLQEWGTHWRKRDLSSFVLVGGAGAGCFSLSLHAMTDFSFAVPGNTFIFFLLLGMSWRLSGLQRQKSKVRKVS